MSKSATNLVSKWDGYGQWSEPLLFCWISSKGVILMPKVTMSMWRYQHTLAINLDVWTQYPSITVWLSAHTTNQEFGTISFTFSKALAFLHSIQIQLGYTTTTKKLPHQPCKDLDPTPSLVVGPRPHRQELYTLSRLLSIAKL